MKALPIGSAEDVAHVADFVDVADRILLDAKPPKGADRPGGLGDTFDWTLLKALDPVHPLHAFRGPDAGDRGRSHQDRPPLRGRRVLGRRNSARASRTRRLIEAFIRNARGASLASIVGASASSGHVAIRAAWRCAYSTGMTHEPSIARHRETPASIPCATAPTSMAVSAIYGGRFVAETLMPLILDLEAHYRAAKVDPAYQGRAQRSLPPTMPAGPARSISPSG